MQLPEVQRKRPGRKPKVPLLDSFDIQVDRAKEEEAKDEIQKTLPKETFFTIALASKPDDRRLGLYVIKKIVIQGDRVIHKETVTEDHADSKGACISMLHFHICDLLRDPLA